jgi:DNA-binding IclR family transcriptional regulator
MGKVNTKSSFKEKGKKKKIISFETEQKPYFLLGSTKKVFAILEILCEEHEKSISELTKRLTLKRSNVHRILATLNHLGYVEQNPDTRNYSPSLKIFELGNAIIKHRNVLSIAHPLLEKLAKQFRETANLGYFNKGEVIYLDKVESPESLRMDTNVGFRVPAYCTALGKVLLAHLTEAELKDYLKGHNIIPHTANTINSPEKLTKSLTQIQERGYAIDDEELYEGVRCIASPILNHTGKVIASVSIAGPSVRMNNDKLAQIKKSLLSVTDEISKKLGYRIHEG